MTDATSDTKQASSSEFRAHVTERGTWVRLIYMLVLGLAWLVAEAVFLAVTILQFLAKLFTGKPIARLIDFGRDLAIYMADIIRFETFVTEDLAFPFAPWPSARTGQKEN